MAGKKIPPGEIKKGPGDKKGGAAARKAGLVSRGARLERRGIGDTLKENLKIDPLEGRASCEALPVNNRLGYLPSFVNMRMAAYPTMKINTQMNHFMLSPPFFLRFWEDA